MLVQKVKPSVKGFNKKILSQFIDFKVSPNPLILRFPKAERDRLSTLFGFFDSLAKSCTLLKVYQFWMSGRIKL